MADGLYRTLVAGIVAATAAIGLYRLGVPGVWLDEAVSWFSSAGTWQRLVVRALATDDSGGILYSSLLKLWIGVAGTSEVALRLPSVAATVALVAAMTGTARLLWGRRAALAVGAMTLLHPSVITASRQARGYALVLLFTALCLLGLAWQAVGRRRAGALLLGAAGLAVTATQMFGLFVAAGAAAASAALAAGPAATPGRRLPAAARALVPFLPAALFAAAWQLAVRRPVQARISTFWITGSLAHNVLVVAATLALPLAAGCAGMLAVDPEPRRRVTIVAGLALAAAPVFAGPIAASLLVSGSHNFVTIRYTLPLALIGTLACGYVLSRAPVRLLVPALAIGAALSLSYAARKNEFASASRAGQETREAAAWLRDRVRPGDHVVPEPLWDWYTLAYYRVPELVKPQALVDGGPGAGPNPSPGLGTTWTVYFTPGEGPGPSAAGPNGGARFGTILITSAGERSGR